MIPFTGNISLKQARQDCDQSANGSHNIQLLQERVLSTTVSQEELRGVACGHHQTFSSNPNYTNLGRTMGHTSRYGAETKGYASKLNNYGTRIGLERNTGINNDATFSVTSFGYCESGTYEIDAHLGQFSTGSVRPQIAVQGYTNGWNSGTYQNYWVESFNSNNYDKDVKKTFTVYEQYPWVSVIIRSIIDQSSGRTDGFADFYRFQRMRRIS